MDYGKTGKITMWDAPQKALALAPTASSFGAGKSSLQKAALCLVTNLNAGTPMLYSSLVLAHLSDLSITQCLV